QTSRHHQHVMTENPKHSSAAPRLLAKERAANGSDPTGALRISRSGIEQWISRSNFTASLNVWTAGVFIVMQSSCVLLVYRFRTTSLKLPAAHINGSSFSF